MEPNAMDQARERIAACQRERSTYLDLSGLGLREWPDELWELEWLEVLNVGNRYHFDPAKQSWAYVYNREQTLNRLATVPKELQRLKKLRGLNLDFNQIVVIGNIEALEQLEFLNLSFNQIQKIEGLQSLTSLNSLYLYNNQIQKIEGLQSLTSLNSLYLYNNQIQKIEGLQSLTSLNRLDLFDNQIQKIEGLQSLTSLNYLDLSDNQIQKIEGLQSLTSLNYLYLDNNQIQKIEGLQSLTSLNHLNLSFNQIQKIEGLQSLTSLNSLDLSDNQIQKIEGLQSLTSLNSLDLSDNQIQKIEGLQSLTSLNHLNLSFNQIQKIEGLQPLTSLNSLDLSDNQIQKIEGLQPLTSLNSLYLGNNQIQKIEGLQSLTSLNRLDLFDNQIQKIEGLQSLTSLNSLNLINNQIQKIEGLQSLTSLHDLYLSDNQIQKIEGLQSLTSLNYLYLDSNQISKLENLYPLKKLYKLQLARNRISFFSWTELENCPELEHLSLRSNPIQQIPAEILEGITIKDKNGGENPHNCLPDLQQWFAELALGAQPNTDFKVILCGNGGVGKSCLTDRLLGKPGFVTHWNSTHGIRIEQLPAFDPMQSGQALSLSLWDFGGQVLYHSAHRIFMRSRAIYLLVWDEEHDPAQHPNSTDPYGLTYPNESLSYWLSTIRTDAQNSPVLVFQNKVDDAKAPYRLPDQNEIPAALRDACSFAHGSAQTQYRLNQVQEQLYTVIQQLPEYGQEMPRSWWALRNLLLEELSDPELRRKKISLDDFATLCRSQGVQERSIESKALLRFLHRTGILFYDEQYMQDDIILDQQWAIDAVYKALDRDSRFFRRTEFNKGRFLAEDLFEEWEKAKYSPADQKLFFQVMGSYNLYFSVRNESGQQECVLPMLLPEQMPPSVTDHWRDKTEQSLHFAYQHRYHLHHAVIQSFIVAVGNKTQLNQIWRKGIWISWPETHTQALVQANFDQRLIQIQVEGREAKTLLDAIRNEFEKIHSREMPVLELAAYDGQHFATLEQIKEQLELENPYVFDQYRQTKLAVARLKWALAPLDEEASLDDLKEVVQKTPPLSPLHNAGPDEGAPPLKVFISYSHDDETHKRRVKALADHLRESCRIEAMIDLYVETSLRESWIDWMRKQIKAADFVLLVCTAKYRERFENEVLNGSGKGVAYEGMIMSHTLYHNYNKSDKFIPVLFEGISRDEDIPVTLQGHSKYWLDGDLESLLRRLTGQPRYKMPDLGGARPVLPPEA